MTNLRSGLTPDELGTVEAVLLDFNHHQIPRLLDIQSRVERGEILDDFDIAFLQETISVVQRFEFFVEKHSDYQTLLAEVANLFQNIAEKAALNLQQEQS